MPYSTLTLEIDARIATLTLARPEALNSMNREFWHELPQAIEAIEAAADVRAVVLAATGKHFCAGMDLSVFASPDPRMTGGEEGRRSEYIRRLVLKLQAIFSAFEALRMPVLAAIQGGCIGGALDMVCCADMRYCTRDAYFQIKETQLGMTADLGTLQRLPRLIPEGLARELAYTGRKLGADEALRCGLVNAVFDDQQALLEGVAAIARDVAAQSPLAVHGCKHMISYARDHALRDSLEYMAGWQAGMFRPQDMTRAMQAAATRSQPDYGALLPIDDSTL